MGQKLSGNRRNRGQAQQDSNKVGADKPSPSSPTKKDDAIEKPKVNN